VADHAVLADDEDDWQGDAVPRTAFRKLRVGDPEGGNDGGLCVGQQRVPDIPGICETLQRCRFVMRDEGDVIAERAKFLDLGVPGDRLDLAVRSPVQRSREQDHQPPAMGQGFEILMLVLMIDGFKVVRDLHADGGPGFERVVR
jgi:hypothetical protein